jgi:hypothetical protein
MGFVDNNEERRFLFKRGFDSEEANNMSVVKYLIDTYDSK